MRLSFLISLVLTLLVDISSLSIPGGQLSYTLLRECVRGGSGEMRGGTGRRAPVQREAGDRKRLCSGCNSTKVRWGLVSSDGLWDGLLCTKCAKNETATKQRLTQRCRRCGGVHATLQFPASPRRDRLQFNFSVTCGCWMLSERPSLTCGCMKMLRPCTDGGRNASWSA